MQIYMVGGAVRDTLLGHTPKDRDYVVVGASAQQMLDLGFRQVGADFPVFLHPETSEEYALARTERKAGRGYNGFVVNAAPTVTLEEDLGRRDLTINSMAMNSVGAVIDPYQGRADLAAKVLRHTTEAFREDPLRLLRVARFLARFGNGWTVAPATYAMLQEIVEEGELDFLTPERVWKEFEKGLMEPHPGLMLHFLHKLQVFERPPFQEYRFDPAALTLPALEGAASAQACSLAVRFALSMPRKWSKEESKISRLPSEVRQVTQLFQHCLEFQAAAEYGVRPAEERLALLETLDVLRQKERFFEVMTAVGLIHPDLATQLGQDARKLWALSNAQVIGDCKDGKQIAQRLRGARLAQLQPDYTTRI